MMSIESRGADIPACWLFLAGSAAGVFVYTKKTGRGI